MTDPGHILVTSASRKAPLVRALKVAAHKLDASVRVIAGDSDPCAPARFIADAFWAMPPSEPDHTDALLDGCKARGIKMILPTRDGELAFWANMHCRFAREGISVVVSDSQSVARCLDKLEFARFGEKAGLPVISAAVEPGPGPGPYVVKERFGAGSRGVGLRLNQTDALIHGARLEHPIYQPFVEGHEISIDAWMDSSGAPRGVILRRRDHLVNGESHVTTTFRDERLEAQATTAMAALKLRGPAVMQAIVNPEGEMRIIECNARFGGASTAAIAAGLDSLYWSLLDARSSQARAVFHRIAGEVRQVRLPSDIIFHDPDF